MIRRKRTPERPPEPPLRIDITLGPEDLEQLWERIDSEQDEIPAVQQVVRLPARPVRWAHDPIDWEYIREMGSGFVGEVCDHYFRGQLIGAEKIPERGPVIVAPNHSGNAFPHDAVMLDLLLWRHDGLSEPGKFRTVYTPQLAAVWWMRPFGLDNWWRRCGGVDMTFANYDRLLERGDRVIYYPEGVPGIGKGFLKRYQLQHFHSSFVALAARHRSPVVPVSVVNAEWVNPTSVTFDWLNNIFRKTVGLPFFPIPTVFAAMLFPFVFYLAFPCRMVFVVGEPIDLRKLLAEEGETDLDHPEREAVLRVAERVRQMSQERLDAAVAEHGKKPWDLRGLWKSMGKIRGRIWSRTPLGWPYAYIRRDRDRERPPARNGLHAFLRDWDILFYYMPLGWIGIALARILRKPPYGYRGLTREERIEREGSFRWQLDERPLPPRPDAGDRTREMAPAGEG
jgi:1-acyl-sn-glycerol-3-phosphate acyltransferase